MSALRRISARGFNAISDIDRTIGTHYGGVPNHPQYLFYPSAALAVMPARDSLSIINK
jgi:hypothetical protein